MTKKFSFISPKKCYIQTSYKWSGLYFYFITAFFFASSSPGNGDGALSLPCHRVRQQRRDIWWATNIRSHSHLSPSYPPIFLFVLPALAANFKGSNLWPLALHQRSHQVKVGDGVVVWKSRTVSIFSLPDPNLFHHSAQLYRTLYA